MHNRLTIAVSLLALALASRAQAQEGTREEKLPTYRFKVSVPVFRCNFEGRPEGRGLIEHTPVNAQFVYIRDLIPSPDTGPAKSVVVLQFLDWVDDTLTFRTWNALDASKGTEQPGRKTYCVEKTIFDRTTERTHAWGRSSWDLAAGVLLLPIKIRLGDFDFSKDVTIGTVVGPRWRLSPTRSLFFSVLGGAGIAAVTLDSASTGGIVRQSTDRAAVTLAAGAMLEMNSFQIGLLFGNDRISEPNRKDWIHHGKPWISLGLGYSLLRPPPNAPARTQ